MTKPPTWIKPQVQLVYAPNQATTAEAPPWFEDILPYTYRAFMSPSVSAKTLVGHTYRTFPVLPPQRP